jgi:hypothetical protein
VLDRADGGGEVGFLACGGVTGARLTLRKGWMGAAMRDALAYIARRRFQESKERFEAHIRSVEQGRKSEPAWGGRRKRPTCGPAASATEKEGKAHARGSWASDGLLGSAQADAGKKSGPCTWETGGARCRATAGLGRIREEK